MDTVASCSFGVDAGSFTDPGSKFVENAARIFQNRAVDMLKLVVTFVPFVGGLLGAVNFNVVKPRQTKFFVDVVRGTIERRRRTGERRNDMVDMMIDLMKEGGGGKEDEQGDEHGEEQFERDSRLRGYSSRIRGFDEDTLVSTAMIMLVAGYDTTGDSDFFFLLHGSIFS